MPAKCSRQKKANKPSGSSSRCARRTGFFIGKRDVHAMDFDGGACGTGADFHAHGTDCSGESAWAGVFSPLASVADIIEKIEYKPVNNSLFRQRDGVHNTFHGLQAVAMPG
jgi:hypothetical protein